MSQALNITLPAPLASAALQGSDRSASAAPAPAAREDRQQALREQLREEIRAELLVEMHAQLEADRAHLAAAAQAARSAAERLDEIALEALGRAGDQLAALALEIAEKVLCQEIADGRARVEPLVRDALEALGPAASAKVHLNPEDLQACELVGSLPQVEFLADASLNRGDVRVESGQGSVRADVSSRIAAAADAIRGEQS
jgi:flagellar assembly protein FliH